MITEVYIRNKRITLDPSLTIGIGGEAEIYDIGSDGALKVYKTSDHPDYKDASGNDILVEQQGAVDRIKAHQQKLPALIQLAPKLPDGIVTPQLLGTDRSGNLIVGYAMNRLDDVEPILNYSHRDYHDKGLSNTDVIDVFRRLYEIVAEGHASGFIIGDFNPLNVLVSSKQMPSIIDADSGQFDKFFCRVYTERYVDPLLCDPNAKVPKLAKPYNTDSDWYSFAVILMQSLLCVGPHGGVYRPKGKTKRIPQGRRPLERVTVFDPAVIYPKDSIAFHFGVLPDDLLNYLQAMFIKDKRDEFPLNVIANVRWTKCTTCGAEHARSKCPVCDKAAPAAIKQTVVIRGKVKATRLFRTSGLIVFAAYQDKKLWWIYHEGGMFKREDGLDVGEGKLNPQVRFRIQRRKTLMGVKGRVVLFDPLLQPQRLQPPRQSSFSVDNYGNLPMFDANQDRMYWLEGGRLVSEDRFAPKFIGNVLARQTLFWVGSTFGFGFYRAGNLNIAFVFNAGQTGINDRVKIPPIRGQLIDSTCFFTQHRCWFLTSSQERGKTINRCAVIQSDGTVDATAEAEAGDGSWLSQLRGKCAVGKYLFVATDSGIIRAEIDGDRIVKTAEFPDTEPFVSSGSHLFPGEGIYVVDSHEVKLIQIG